MVNIEDAGDFTSFGALERVIPYALCLVIVLCMRCRLFSRGCRCFRPANLPRGPQGSRLCGGDRDQETENSKVCTRTRDTRFIQVRTAKVASPTSCLGDQVWRPALCVGFRSSARLGTRPSFI
jgi:hypothetical protein